MEELQRKGERNYCLNCQVEIRPLDTYCSNCGQKVDDNKLGLRDVLREFFENYISLDSRFGRSLKPFFFKPGYLSKQFMEGKRRSFANPFRLYILSSIFFFFSLTSYINSEKRGSQPIFNIKQTELKRFDGLSDTSYTRLNQALPSSAKKELNQQENIGFTIAYAELKPLHKKIVIENLSDQELETFGLQSDTSLLDRNLNVNVDFDSERNSDVIDISGSQIVKYKDSTHLSDEDVYERIIGDREGETSVYEEIILKRLIRLNRANEANLRGYVLGNLSLAMLVLIPLFALVLKLFYLRKNRFYVAHLIHTLYLQAFAFILFGLVFGISNFIPSIRDWNEILQLLAIFLFLIYFMKSLRRLYRQSKIKTFLKGIFLVFSYFMIAMVVFLGEVIISFLLF